MPYPVPDQSPTFPEELPLRDHFLRHIGLLYTGSATARQANPAEGGDRPDAVQGVCHLRGLQDVSAPCDLSHPHGGFPGAPGGILAHDRRLWHTHLPQDVRHHDGLSGRMFALAAGRYEEISQAPTVQRACMPCPGLQRRARSPPGSTCAPKTTATRGLAIVPSGTEFDAHLCTPSGAHPATRGHVPQRTLQRASPCQFQIPWRVDVHQQEVGVPETS